jgi:hypothetical protein
MKVGSFMTARRVMGYLFGQTEGDMTDSSRTTSSMERGTMSRNQGRNVWPCGKLENV